MKQLRVLLPSPPGWDGGPSQGYPPVTILYTWVERDNVGYSILSKKTTRLQGLGVEPPTFRFDVQRANHYTTAPLQVSDVQCNKSDGALKCRVLFILNI